MNSVEFAEVMTRSILQWTVDEVARLARVSARVN